ncbi:MAG: hypothetical protein K5912_03645, partial [Alphaproteobacteria bacterium]|nr:hypothetical protein [Alphaproteobacteria bacterium]
MGKIIFLFLCFVTTGALAGEACEYANIVNELKENCGGINTELRQIKQLSTANVAVTGVGTAAAGGALYAGIKKKDFDERAEKLIQSMQRIDNMS